MSELDDNKATYLRFIEILTTQDFDALPEVLDVGAYREVCVGAMQDWADYETAVASVRRIAAMMGSLDIDITHCVAEGDKVFALATVPTPAGSTPKALPTFMFDYVKLAGGKIVERVQMADLSGMAQQQGSWAGQAQG